VSFEDKTLQCRECGASFTWTAGEQEFYAQKGLVNIPSRCTDCRKARRSTGNFASSNSSDRSGRSERVRHPVTCASCGKQTTVPFVPKYDRPVFCSDCFDRSRTSAGAGASR
jgi:CxxC-x17-CxxC domain-containing protein